MCVHECTAADGDADRNAIAIRRSRAISLSGLTDSNYARIARSKYKQRLNVDAIRSNNIGDRTHTEREREREREPGILYYQE